jgi:hypothetical protein
MPRILLKNKFICRCFCWIQPKRKYKCDKKYHCH